METTSSVIVLDSDSDDGGTAEKNSSQLKRKAKTATIAAPKSPATVLNENGKRTITTISGTQDASSDIVRKRIKPITIATNVNNNMPVGAPENFASITYSEDWEQDMKQYQKELAVKSSSSTLPPATPSSSRSSTTNDELDSNSQCVPAENRPMSDKSNEDAPPSRNGEHVREKNPIGKEFLQLLDACRKADPSKEMETLIEKKLLRYYKVVHPDYINSKSFIKAVKQVTADVLAHPTLVFLKLSSIVEELNVRRKSGILASSQPPAACKDTAPVATDSPSSGSTKKDRQIAKLNRTLYCLTKRIKQLEEADVDFNHEINSSYLMAERYKKRAFEVYEKICDITGESKNAHRLVRKPIRFEGTPYPEFNRMLQLFVNRTNTFPNFRDVLKCLQHCNGKNGYGLRTDQMNRIAQDAFYKVGKQLQKRRKTDLYETVVYHAGEEKDPALIDHSLKKKLEENGKYYSKVNQIIEKYAQHERMAQEDTNVDAEAMKSSESQIPTEGGSDAPCQNAQSKPSSSSSGMNTPSAPETSASLATTSGNSQVTGESPNSSGMAEQITDTDDEDDDDDDEEDDDEEEDEFESTTKENVRPDNFEDIIISDDEELIVPES
ncbi:daxx-like protein [Anopheles ziemanni]|uniref:daxx-like protein n=1 Tax=Anopheles coustani TaxID=139045 RepID=UPI00265869F1|nr:daxx-like protein [Anopheles coustani]XP_058168576.1 daxx-like protein [Anopheles ziemanni]